MYWTYVHICICTYVSNKREEVLHLNNRCLTRYLIVLKSPLRLPMVLLKLSFASPFAPDCHRPQATGRSFPSIAIMKIREKNVSNRKQVNRTEAKNQDNEVKTFNKKKYRLQKYSNKYKLNQWEERRKKAILRDFHKELDKNQCRQNLKKPLSLKNINENKNNKEVQPHKSNAFHKAKQELLHKKEEQKRQKEEALRIKLEREEALKKYKEKKMQTFKKLSKKTKKGQPVMKDRLEILLEKIQQQVSK
ncbi:uncharacterized protein LOC143177469 [Calliopsis andreniformis]|uniref:uncharacterized protein LOC143177469 n=1 Tax=Calliopsis andreniformis TaxID=337506 RepID=UPI003FCDA802